MRIMQAFARRRAAIFAYPYFAMFLVTLKQNVRGIVTTFIKDVPG